MLTVNYVKGQRKDAVNRCSDSVMSVVRGRMRQTDAGSMGSYLLLQPSGHGLQQRGVGQHGLRGDDLARVGHQLRLRQTNRSLGVEQLRLAWDGHGYGLAFGLHAPIQSPSQSAITLQFFKPV